MGGELVGDAGGLPAFAVGSLVASYRLEERVGTGGLGEVFRALDVRLGRIVALKLLAPPLAAAEEVRHRFLHEARAVAAVDDPHILPVYEAGEANGVLFIAMRYVSGGDVKSLLRREGPLPPARAEAIISPVASALDAAHAAGLVHGDVKPANMLLETRPDGADQVYLSDFGLSTTILHRVDPNERVLLLGAPSYAAPEQIQGLSVDGRADQYSLACAAFELLTGAPPFRKDDPSAVLYAQVAEPPPPLTSRRPGLPPAADQVFATALAKDPEARYRSCKDFADALAEALGLKSPPPSPDHLDEDVRFTVYRPQMLSPGQWATLLVFAHKTTLVAEPGRAPVDPQAQVEARARAHFGGAPPRPVGDDARHGLARGAQLRIVPDLPGIRSNPQEAELEWWEPVHEVVFRLLAGSGLAGTVVRGMVRVWCGPLIVGEVSIAIQVAADGPVAQSPPVAESAQRYRKIFPSYSHHDRAVVTNFAEVVRALGDDYLQDVLTLRAGEQWHPRLLQLIEEADVFQLFWSSNSMRSPHCRDEWEHALALQRPQFVRPVFWEEPRPEDPGQGLPPEALAALHFVKVPSAGPDQVYHPPPPGVPGYAGGSAYRSYPGPPQGRSYPGPPPGRPRRVALTGVLLVVAAIVALLVALIVWH